MSNTNFVPMNDEQREQAKQTREAKKLLAQQTLKLEYADENHWTTLASKYSVRLPVYYQPSSEIKYVRRVAKKLNIDISDFLASTGYTNVKSLAAANPTWTARAICGTLLEFYDDNLNNTYIYLDKSDEKAVS